MESSVNLAVPLEASIEQEQSRACESLCPEYSTFKTQLKLRTFWWVTTTWNSPVPWLLPINPEQHLTDFTLYVQNTTNYDNMHMYEVYCDTS